MQEQEVFQFLAYLNGMSKIYESNFSATLVLSQAMKRGKARKEQVSSFPANKFHEMLNHTAIPPTALFRFQHDSKTATMPTTALKKRRIKCCF